MTVSGVNTDVSVLTGDWRERLCTTFSLDNRKLITICLRLAHKGSWKSAQDVPPLIVMGSITIAHNAMLIAGGLFQNARELVADLQLGEYTAHDRHDYVRACLNGGTGLEFLHPAGVVNALRAAGELLEDPLCGAILLGTVNQAGRSCTDG